MAGPSWLADALAVLMLLIAGYCVTRIPAARRLGRAMHHDINLAHVAMGVAMAGMFVVGLRVLPNGAWEAVFAGFTLWFGARIVGFVRRRGLWAWDEDRMHHVSHYSTHLVMAGAMVFMLGTQRAVTSVHGSVASALGMSMAAPTGPLVIVAYLFVLVLIVSAVWHADGLSRFAKGQSLAVAAPADVLAAQRVVEATAGVPETAVLPPPATQQRWLAPRLESGCHIAACVAMGYMLIILR